MGWQRVGHDLSALHSSHGCSSLILTDTGTEGGQELAQVRDLEASAQFPCFYPLPQTPTPHKEARMRQRGGVTDSVDMSLSKLQGRVKDGEDGSPRGGKSDTTE